MVSLIQTGGQVPLTVLQSALWDPEVPEELDRDEVGFGQTVQSYM